MSDLAKSIALIAVSRAGVELAVQLATAWPHATLCLPPRWSEGLEQPHRRLEEPLKEALPALWQEFGGLVFFLASGAVVRLIAPLLTDKFVDPAVVVVDGAGQFAIPLLSGHLGGANQLAREVAMVLGGTPVITTASDSTGLLAVDLLGQQQGWQLDASPLELRQAAAAVVNGDAVALILEGDWQDALPPLPPWITLCRKAVDLSPYAAVLWVTQRPRHLLPTAGWSGPLVVYTPPRVDALILGVGCDRGTHQQTIQSAIHTALLEHGYRLDQVVALATIDRKGDEEGLLAVVKEYNWPLHLFTSEALNQVNPPNPSETVRRHMGVASVAEASALLASANGGLVISKQCYRGTDGRNVTVAAARIHHG
ncbi:MAG: cobalamin biosynthesis protein CbiG [Magnetococcales bacterium]|nr:cobalamin biosynthesis protein [Magnetococcales bacterium]NGZ25487.1 cobalamin biosynthesis protein CbiG [Magnetococcales bacterium]